MKMKIIYPLFQKKVAMLGFELISSVSGGCNHHGAYRESIRRFSVGGYEFSGDYGMMRITAKNLSMFDVITTDYEIYTQLRP